MNNTKLKNILVALLIVVLSLSIAFCAVACAETPEDNKPTGSENEETTTETLLITNGRFDKFTTGTAPFSPSSWTSSVASSDTTPAKGVISLDPSVYENHKAALDNLAYPGNPNDEAENKALVLYNKQANATTYTSSSFKTAVGGYYKITAQYRVVGGEVGITQGSGAYITVTGDAYHRFGPFGATESWETVTFFVTASQTKAQTLNVALSLGISENRSTGYAFFDNVVAEKLEGKVAFDEAIAAMPEGSDYAVYSMLTPDQDFINVSGLGNVKSVAGWSYMRGTGNGADCDSNYVSTGIIDMNNEDSWKDWEDKQNGNALTNPGTPYSVSDDKTGLSNDGHILAISNLKALSTNGARNYEDAFTAYGYGKKNDRTINVEPNTYYTLSVWVYTELSSASDILADFTTRELDGIDSTIDHSKYGANIKLAGYDDYLFENINTGKTWQKYTFVLLGNPARAKELSLELWLGLGGKEDATRANGAVYFDNIRLEKLGGIEDRDALIAEYTNAALYNQEFTKVVDLSAKELADNLIPNSWTVNPVNDINVQDGDMRQDTLDVNALADAVANAVVKAEGEPDEDYAARVEEWWQSNFNISENPLAPYEMNPITVINHLRPSAHELRTAEFTIVQNLHYRLSVWVKTADIAEGSGITAALMNAEDDSVLQSIKKVNTASYHNDLTNGYVELVFYIQGKNLTSLDGKNDVDAYLSLTFGTGNNFDTDEFLSGQLYVANVNMEQVTYSEYNNVTTGTYVVTKSLATSKGTVSNGSFDSVSYEEDRISLENGNQTELLKPANWTTSTVDNVKQGILNVNSTALINNVLGSGFEIYNAWEDDTLAETRPVNFGEPNLYLAYTEAPVKASKLINSSSFSASSNSYYIIKGYVRAIGTVGQLSISTSSRNTSPVYLTFGMSGSGEWEEVIFVMETGNFGSTSVTINLYIGNYSGDTESKADTTYEGKIFADSFSYLSISKDKYEEQKNDAAGSLNYMSLIVDTFDTTSTSENVTSPNVWTGSGSTASSSVNSESQVIGIYTSRYGTSELLFKDKVTSTDENGKEVVEYVTNDELTLTKDDIFDTTGMPAGTEIGDSMLVINNAKPDYYQYKNSSGITLSKGNSYRLSLWVRTFNIKEGDHVVLRVVADGSTYEIPVNSEYVRKIGQDGKYEMTTNDEGKSVNVYEKVESKWQQYNFYFRTTDSESISGVYAYIIFGTKTATVQGTVLVDNVSLETIDEDVFTTEYAKRYVLETEGEEAGNAKLDEDGNKIDADGADSYLLNNLAIRFAEDVEDDQESEEEEKPQEEPTDSSTIWATVGSIVIAVVLLAVVIVFIVRAAIRKGHLKLKPRKAKKTTYDRDNLKIEDSKKADTEIVTDDERDE